MPATIVEPPRRGRALGYDVLGAHKIDWGNPKDEDLLVFVDTQVRAHDTRHLWWVRKAKVQLAWAEGEQLKIWDPHSRSLIDSYDVQTDRIALFANRLKPAVLNWISLITAREVSFRVHPATDEDTDIESARVMDKLSTYYWRKLLGNTKFVEALWLMFCTGCSFLMSTWDPFQGQMYSLKPEDVLDEKDTKGGVYTVRQRFANLIGSLLGVDGRDVDLSEEGSYQVGEGDLACDLLTGFEVVPPFRATGIDTSSWLMVRRHHLYEEIQERYGEKAKELTPGLSEANFTYQDYTAYQYPSERQAYGLYSLQQSPDHVLVYEIWRPKSRRYPKGFYGVVCQQKVLKKGPNPYEHGEIPVVMLQELPSPKHFWPPSTLQDLMSLQMEMNVTLSQVAEHKAATVQPRILAERNAGLDELAFTARQEIVEVAPGKLESVKPWIPEPLPAYLPYWDERLRRDFEDVSRNHAPSYGRQKGSIKSGRHAIALQEADARLNSPMMRLLQDSLAHVCRQWGSILHQFVPEERTLTIVGENTEPEVLTWSKEALPHEIHNVTCDLGTALDRSTTMQLIDMLTARGWLSPAKEQDQRLVYRWLGEGVATEVDPTKDDRRNASVENKSLLQGRYLNVPEGDDDTVHLEEHARIMKHAQYRRRALANPDVETCLEVHMREHERSRLRKVIRQKVMAQEIEVKLIQELGLLPPMGAGGPPSKPPTPAPPADQSRKQRPVRASRRIQTAPGGYEQRSSGLLVPQ